MQSRNTDARNRKRVWNWMVAGLLAFAPVAVGAEEVKFMRADLNDDGLVDRHDVLLAMDYVTGHGSLRVIEAADVLNDGVLNEGDVFAILHMAQSPVPALFDPENVRIDRGDVNGDNQIDEQDADDLDLHINFRQPLLYAPLDAADVNDDGVINRKDQDALAKLLVEEGNTKGGTGTVSIAAPTSSDKRREVRDPKKPAAKSFSSISAPTSSDKRREVRDPKKPAAKSFSSISAPTSSDKRREVRDPKKPAAKSFSSISAPTSSDKRREVRDPKKPAAKSFSSIVAPSQKKSRGDDQLNSGGKRPSKLSAKERRERRRMERLTKN